MAGKPKILKAASQEEASSGFEENEINCQMESMVSF